MSIFDKAIEKELLAFADEFGEACGAYQNLHPVSRESLRQSANTRMLEILTRLAAEHEGKVLVPVELFEQCRHSATMGVCVYLTQNPRY
tara:strand:+ start:2442 stop:2708 length:267 start_codon:yes stop_codon:yes gene_type:complete